MELALARFRRLFGSTVTKLQSPSDASRPVRLATHVKPTPNAPNGKNQTKLKNHKREKSAPRSRSEGQQRPRGLRERERAAERRGVGEERARVRVEVEALEGQRAVVPRRRPPPRGGLELDDEGPALGLGDDLRRNRVIRRRFNVSVPHARVPEKASTLRERSEG